MYNRKFEEVRLDLVPIVQRSFEIHFPGRIEVLTAGALHVLRRTPSATGSVVTRSVTPRMCN